MRLNRHLYSILLAAFALITMGGADLVAAGGGGHGETADINFPLPDTHYQEIEAHKAQELGRDLTLVETLKLRASEDPFNVVASVIFLLAIGHTFIAGSLMKLAHKFEHEHEHKLAKGIIPNNGLPEKKRVSFKATLFHFLGEVEAVFGMWLIPLVICIIFMKHDGWHTALGYIDGRNFVEPMVVVVLMAIASSRPIVQAAERNVTLIAGLGGRSPGAYWFSILTIAPLLGSFITEPAAMTIAAILLGQQFYKHNPSANHKYATLGLLFVNISVGGTLTHFAAPPVLMVASKWGWDMPFMFDHFGYKAIIGIVISNLIYFTIFRKSFAELKKKVSSAPQEAKKEEHAPIWVVAVHAAFLAWTITVLHHPPLFIGGFLFFLAFTMATDHHQYQIQLKGPMLVGFFLAGLVTHGGLQGWWISPVLSSLTELPLFIGATVLTGFNDNAAITYLASQVPLFNEPGALSDALRYAVVAGAVTGGGLTVIANAPNPAGQSLLSKYFDGGIAPFKLLLAALIPTIILALCFMLLPSF